MISIIVICFNSLKELKITLPALFSSIGIAKKTIVGEFEIILSDDGSEDGTQEWIQSNYPKVRYLWHKNIGRGQNRNFGAAHANGDYLVFIDSDVEVDPQAILYLLMHLQDNPDCVCFGNIRLVIEKQPSPLSYYLSQKWEKLMHRFGETLDPWDSYSGFFSISKKLFNQKRGFSSDFTQYGGEDTEFFLRCHDAGVRFFFAKGALGWHHQSLDLDSNLHRIYLSKYSSTFIHASRSAKLEAEIPEIIFSHAWYDQIFKFLTTNKLWSKLLFLHVLFRYFPKDSRLAFHFYHNLFQEYAEKGYGAGGRAKNESVNLYRYP
jgi:glycosyltransferase involved in cell wall biosynthesis